jgi:hypothetical protein
MDPVLRRQACKHLVVNLLRGLASTSRSTRRLLLLHLLLRHLVAALLLHLLQVLHHLLLLLRLQVHAERVVGHTAAEQQQLGSQRVSGMQGNKQHEASCRQQTRYYHLSDA